MRAYKCGIPCDDGGKIHTMYTVDNNESHTMECEDCGMKLFGDADGTSNSTTGEFV